MRKKIIGAVLGMSGFLSLGYTMGQSREIINPSGLMDTNSKVDVNADTNGVTTSMNGNTRTNSGLPISSTSASAESRNTSGSD